MNRKGFVPIILIVIVVVGFIAASGVWYASNRKAVAPEINPTPPTGGSVVAPTSFSFIN